MQDVWRNAGKVGEDLKFWDALGWMTINAVSGRCVTNSGIEPEIMGLSFREKHNRGKTATKRH